jgi:hypothetical protein
MMTKALTTNLLNARFTIAPGLEHCWPSTFKPAMDGQFVCTIIGAWVEAGAVRLLGRDPHGNVAEFWATQALYLNDGSR